MQNLVEEISKCVEIELLFEEKPNKPTANAIFREARKSFGDIEIISREEQDIKFNVNKYVSYNKDNTTTPVGLFIGDIKDFDDKASVSEFERTQIWNIANSEELLPKYKYAIKIGDMNANRQIPKERAIMLVEWLDIVLKLYPTCQAIWIKSAGKLQLAQSIKSFKEMGTAKYLFSMVNIRFFNVPNTNEFIVDTVGLAGIGLSDVQFHFKGMNPNKVANLSYSLARYILDNDDVLIKDGDTIDGMNDQGKMTPDVQWICRYEDSLIEPLRPVLDINTGKYAAGDRN